MPIRFRGYALDQSTADKFLLAEKWIRVKYPSFTLVLVQGSYSSGVAASGGTHDGGGVADVHCIGDSDGLKIEKMHYFRACLGFGWHRPYNWDGAGGGEHMHIGELGNPHMSAALAAQVPQWNAGENGLANHAKDTDPIDVAAGRPARITTPPGVVPVATLEPLMYIIQYPHGPGWSGDFLFTGVLHPIKSPAAEAALTALGVPTKVISTAAFNALVASFGIAA